METKRCCGVTTNLRMFEIYEQEDVNKYFFSTDTAVHAKKCMFVIENQNNTTKNIRCIKCNSALRNLNRTTKRLLLKEKNTQQFNLEKTVLTQIQCLVEDPCTTENTNKDIRKLTLHALRMFGEVKFNLTTGINAGMQFQACAFIQGTTLAAELEMTNVYLINYPNVQGHLMQDNSVKHYECIIFEIKQKREEQAIHCKLCSKLKQRIVNAIHRESNFNEENINKTRNDVLTKIELLQKVDYLRKSMRNGQAVITYTKQIIRKTFEEETIINEDDMVISIANKVAEDPKLEELFKNLLKAKVQCESKTSNKSFQVSEEEYSEFAKSFCESLKNKAKRLCGKSNMCRYSSATLRFALMLYHNSPKTYEYAQQSPYACLPSTKTIQNYVRLNKSCSGKFIMSYKKIAPTLCDDEKAVLLYMDEMKLQGGLAWSTSTHNVVGFADDGISWETMIPDVQDNLVSQDNSKVAQYVCQYKLRTCKTSKTFPGEFFYSGKQATTRELVAQIRHVLLSLVLTGFRVRAIVMDSGSTNVNAIRKINRLLNSYNLYNVQMQQSDCTIKFEFNQTPIVIIPCSSHLLKNMRNCLHATATKSKRCLNRVNCEPISWLHIVEAWKRDLNRIKCGHSQKTKLTEASIDLIAWSKMRVCLAKYVFDSKTCSEMISFLCVKNKIQAPQIICSEVPGQLMKVEETNIVFGLLSTKVLYLLSVQKFSPADNSLIETLLFLCFTHKIFLEILLNSKFKFTRKNIASVQEFLFYRLGYFVSWQNGLSAQADANNNVKWNFLAKQTWRSLKNCVNGILFHAKLTLECEQNIEYIPVLHGNTSTLESMFACIRGANNFSKTGVQEYSKAVTCLSFKHVSTALKGKSYDSNDCFPCVNTQFTLKRKNCFMEYQGMLVKMQELNVAPTFKCLDTDMNVQLFVNYQNGKFLLQELVQNEKFCSVVYATQDINSEHQCLLQFFTFASVEVANNYEMFLNGILSAIIKVYVTFLQKVKHSKLKNVSFEDFLMDSAQSGKVKQAFEVRFEDMHPISVAAKYVFLEFFLPHVRDFVTFLQKDETVNSHESNQENNEYEFTVFVGFAIQSCLKKFRKLTTPKNKKVDIDLTSAASFLEKLRSTESSNSLEINFRNKGALFLPDTSVRRWGELTLKLIQSVLPTSLFCPSTIKNGWKVLQNASGLQKEFDFIVQKKSMNVLSAKTIEYVHQMLLKKVFHAKTNECFKAMKKNFIISSDTQEKNPFRENLKHFRINK